MGMSAAEIAEMLGNARSALNSLLTGTLVDTKIGDFQVTRSTTIRELRGLIADLEKQERAIPAERIRIVASRINRFGGDESVYIGDD